MSDKVNGRKRLMLFACNVLFRELSICAAHSPHLIDTEFLHRSLHGEPAKLHDELQARIDKYEGANYDALIFGYGLCSNGLADLQARDIPLVIPRAHDCITLLLGSKEAYEREFVEAPGTYYYTPGWIEREGLATERTSVEGEKARAIIRKEFVEKYGEDNADFLMEMLHSWQKNYRRAAYIEMGLVDLAEIKAKAQAIAQEYGWEYSEQPGDLRLNRLLVTGEWNDDDFVVVPPGYRTVQSLTDERIIECVRCPDSEEQLSKT